jgi:hypothetical protein
VKRILILLIISCALSSGVDANNNSESYLKGRTDLSLDIGYLGIKTPNPFTWWTDNYRKNPLPYKFAPLQITWHRQATNVSGEGFLRGNWEYQASLVYTSIVDGPESRWGGFAGGVRYNFVSRDTQTIAPFVDFRVGAGGIDASGVKDGQEKDLTYTFLIGIGVRINYAENAFVTVQTLTQHISNGWATNPSAGIDLTGFSVGWGFKL